MTSKHKKKHRTKAILTDSCANLEKKLRSARRQIKILKSSHKKQMKNQADSYKERIKELKQLQPENLRKKIKCQTNEIKELKKKLGVK